MKKAYEYRQHAAECRKLARRMASDRGRDELLSIAAQWDELAEAREALIRKNPDLADAEERAQAAPANGKKATAAEP